MMSHWCNYSCEYRGVPVFFKRSSSRGPQYHAFDYYPVEKWIEGFRKFPQKDINLTVTGGEPFLDNKNFPHMLQALCDDRRYTLRIYTNGFWNPEPYRNFDKSKVYLTSTFHSSQTSFDDYRKRLLRIREAGFQFATVSIVLAPENLPNAEHALTTLESDGFPVIGGAMQPAGRYMDRLERTPEERQLLRRFGNPFAIHRVVVNPKTEGDPYYHPAFSYRLHPDGSVNVACIGARQNIFTAGLPELPRHAVACPVQHCEGCPEMVRAIVNVPYYNRPLSIYHPDEALQENIELRESLRNGADPQHNQLFDII
jgi:MoaA/NifB/PqqE/SkfB family radical SAM enzyme